jgi:thiol-disulfide isomerase/thioredoxin
MLLAPVVDVTPAKDRSCGASRRQASTAFKENKRPAISCKGMTEMKRSWPMYSLLLCGSVMIGCGETTDSAVSDTTPAAAPAAGAVAEAPSDPLLVGIEFDDPKEYSNALAAYQAKPTDSAAVEAYAGTLLSMAWAHAQGGNAAMSDESLTRGGKLLLKAHADGVKLPVAPESTLQAEILYGYACVLGKQKQGKESLTLLGKAVEVGFSNAQMLKTDKDLEVTRTLPGYETQLVAWEAHFAELQKQYEAQLVEKAKTDLAAGETFPFDFQLVDVNGKLIKLSDFKVGNSADAKGQVCVVDIWGTWCPPCRQEVATFVKLQDKYGKYGFQMIGLNDERGGSEEANISTVKNFMANTSMNYPCAMIKPEVMEQLPDFQGFPTTLFIDHHGKVRLKAFGFHEYKYMEAVVHTLMTEQAREFQAAATN